MNIRFTIDCIPPKATAQQKQITMIGGKPRMYDPRNVKQAKSDFLTLLGPYKPDRPIEGPVRLSIVWTYPWRKSEPKKNRIQGLKPCDTRPDCSNLVKAFEDCLTRLGFWNDDSQVFDLRFQKYWGDKPGIDVRIEKY